jgi:hypothetical protein
MPGRALRIFAITLLVAVSPTAAAVAQSFKEFANSLSQETDSLAGSRAAVDYIRSHGVPVIEDTMIHFLYRGTATSQHRENSTGGTLRRENCSGSAERTSGIAMRPFRPTRARSTRSGWTASG